MKRRFKEAFFLAITIAAVLFLLEAAVRIYDIFKYKTPFFKSFASYTDPILGWRDKVALGDPSSGNPKILFLGDSFTAFSEESEEGMYYDIIRKRLGAEASIFASPGYGTLQEYLALDMVIDNVQPDLIVLQVTSNDLINNSWDLENRSLINNNFSKRPYLIDGRIEMRFSGLGGEVRVFLTAYSRLFYRIWIKVDILVSKFVKNGYLHTIEDDVDRYGQEFPYFKKSVETTDRIIEMMKLRTGGIPIVAFIADDKPVYTRAFREIFSNNGIDLIEDVPHLIKDAESRGEVMTISDHCHWNDRGKKIVGDFLSDELMRKNYMKARVNR